MVHLSLRVLFQTFRCPWTPSASQAEQLGLLLYPRPWWYAAPCGARWRGTYRIVHRWSGWNYWCRGTNRAVNNLPLTKGLQLRLHVTSPCKVVLAIKLGECRVRVAGTVRVRQWVGGGWSRHRCRSDRGHRAR